MLSPHNFKAAIPASLFEPAGTTSHSSSNLAQNRRQFLLLPFREDAVALKVALGGRVQGGNLMGFFASKIGLKTSSKCHMKRIHVRINSQNKNGIKSVQKICRETGSSQGGSSIAVFQAAFRITLQPAFGSFFALLY